MQKLNSIREVQQVSKYIFCDLLRFCKLNRLNVYLTGGCLIGAVRNKGFIPWDDDIDVAISRQDYTKLVKLAKNGWISEKCRIVDPEIDKDFKGYIPLVVYNDSKLVSYLYREPEELKISISIFVYDGVPTSIFMQKIFFAYIYFLRAQHALCRANFKYVNTKRAKIFGPLLKHFYSTSDVYKYKEKILNCTQRYRYSESTYCSCNCDPGASKEVCERKAFEIPVEIEFDGMKCYTFSHYKEDLKNVFGDYMQLPPENKRVPKHSFVCWVEDGFPFTES